MAPCTCSYILLFFVKVLVDNYRAELLTSEIIVILFIQGLFYLPCTNTHQLDVFPATQPSVSKHWGEQKAPPWSSGMTCCFLHATPTWHAIPWAHLSPNPKRHLDRFSLLCRDNRSLPILYNETSLPFPQNCPFPRGDLDSHLVHGSLGSPSPQPKRHLDLHHSRFWRAHCVIETRQTDGQTMLLGR